MVGECLGGCCLLIGLLFVVCCLLFVVCCLLFAVCCLLFVVCCLSLSTERRMLVVGGCSHGSFHSVTKKFDSGVSPAIPITFFSTPAHQK